MNFNIYVPDELGKNLLCLSKETGKNRNTLIREALETYVFEHQHKQWSEMVLNFKGSDEDSIEFESFRSELKDEQRDIFKD
jgi:predicted DNA-binding protein